MQKKQAEQQREDAAKLNEMNVLSTAMGSGKLTDEGYEAAMNRVEELTATKGGGKGKGGKGEQPMIRTVLQKLKGQIPPDEQYKPQTLSSTVAKSAQAKGGQPADPNAPPTAPPHAFKTAADRRAEAQQAATDQVDADTAAYKKINETAAKFTDPDSRRSFLFWSKALPPEKKQTAVFKPGIDPQTNHQVMHVFDEEGKEINSFDMGLPAGSKPQKVKVITPDGKVTDGIEHPGGLFTDGDNTPLPSGTRLIGDEEAKGLQQKQALADEFLSSGQAKTPAQAEKMASDMIIAQERKKATITAGKGGTLTPAQRSSSFQSDCDDVQVAVVTEARTALNQANSQEVIPSDLHSKLGVLGTDPATAKTSLPTLLIPGTAGCELPDGA